MGQEMERECNFLHGIGHGVGLRSEMRCEMVGKLGNDAWLIGVTRLLGACIVNCKAVTPPLANR